MLLATVGQASTYTSKLYGTSNSNNSNGSVGGIDIANSKIAGINDKKDLNNSLKRDQQIQSRSLLSTAQHTNNKNYNKSSTVNAASSLIKTLSVRLHRSTEFIKDTVQKALIISAGNTATTITHHASTGISAIATTSSTTTTSSSISSLSSNIKATSLARTKVSTYTTATITNTGLGGINFSSSSSSSSSSNSSSTTNSNCSNVATRTITTTALVSATTTAGRALLPTASFINLYTVPPTALHRSGQARQNAGSTDSLLKELCHFKPIRTSPLTPTRSSHAPGCDLKLPKIQPASIELLSRFADYSTATSSSNNSNLLQLTSNKPHKSAFVCFINVPKSGKLSKPAAHTKTKSVSSNNSGIAQCTKPRIRRRRAIFTAPSRRYRRRNKEMNDFVESVPPIAEMYHAANNIKTSTKKRKQEQFTEELLTSSSIDKRNKRQRITYGNLPLTTDIQSATARTRNAVVNNTKAKLPCRTPPMTRQRARQISSYAAASNQLKSM